MNRNNAYKFKRLKYDLFQCKCEILSPIFYYYSFIYDTIPEWSFYGDWASDPVINDIYCKMEKLAFANEERRKKAQIANSKTVHNFSE